MASNYTDCIGNDVTDKHYYNCEMINGVADGYGIEYAWNGGPIIYKGNWKNGVYEGQGTLYDEHGNILHDGWFKDGLRWLEDEFWTRGAYGLRRNKYIGDIVNGKANGQGAEYQSGPRYGHSYLSYQGEFTDGKRNGYGTEYNSDGKIRYKGKWKDDKRNGNGTEYWPNGKYWRKGLWENDIFICHKKNHT